MSAQQQIVPNGSVMMDGNMLEQQQQQQQQIQIQPVSKPVKPKGGVQSHYELEEFSIPQFKLPLENAITVDEGEPIRLLTQVDPVGDNSLAVEWYKDGRPLTAGSRFSTMFDRGYALIDILYSIEEDSGVYVCVAKNNSGQAESNQASITVNPEAKIDSNADFIQSQHTMPNESEPDQPDRHQPTHPPQIVQDIGTGQVQINQGEPVHLELKVEPRNDVTLRVDWLKNGNSISLGSRTNAIYDRGYCALDIMYSYPEDNGTYVCLITNSLGQTQSSPVEIICNPDEKVVTKSNLNEESINNLQKFENIIQEATSGIDFINVEETEDENPPVFDKGLQDMVIDEGLPVKFLIKVNSHPRALIVWSINNEEIVPDSINKFYQDGTINYLELSRCNDVGVHSIRVVATNKLGQAASDCTLTVNPVNNYSQDLKHIVPENPYKKMAQLKKVECTPELTNAFKKPKPSTDKIVKIERTSEVKSKHHKTQDVLETEKLYDNVAANLKTKGGFSTGKKPLLNYDQEQVQKESSSVSAEFSIIAE